MRNLRAATEGFHFVRNLWRGLDAKVEVVTPKRVMQWLEPRLTVVRVFTFNDLASAQASAGLAGTLQYKPADWR